MAREYKCTFCSKPVAREQLTAMRVQFTAMGKPTRVIRSRVVSWLCPECIEYEPQWHSDRWIESPGLAKATPCSHSEETK